MTNYPAPSIKSTARHAAPATTYKPRVSLTSRRGWYRVQSSTDSTTYYETTANSCSCPARKLCKHMRFVRRLNVAFYVRREAAEAVPVTLPEPPQVVGLDAQIAQTEELLAIARRALTDTDVQSDEYAVLLRAVDLSERAVAAVQSAALRAV